MSLTKKDLMNELYDASLITLGAVAVSMASRKVFKDGLGVPGIPQRELKLVAAIGGGSLAIQYLQKKEFVPNDPFK